MEQTVVSKKLLAFILIFSAVILLGYFIFAAFDKRTTIAFCKSSTGIITYIRIKNSIDVLLYPDSKKVQNTLVCLGKYMPFYDKTIEYMYGERNFFRSSLYKEFKQYYSIKTLIGKPYSLPDTKTSQEKQTLIKGGSTVKIEILSSTLYFDIHKSEEIIVWEEDTYRLGIINSDPKNINNERLQRINTLVLNKTKISREGIYNVLASIEPKTLIYGIKGLTFVSDESRSSTHSKNISLDLYYSFKK